MSALAAIHVAKKQLGLDDATYRSVLLRVTGKSSAGQMNETERRNVVQELRRQGFKPLQKGLEGPFAAKLQALWIAAYNLGIVRDRSDTAILTFIKRQSGIDHVRFLQNANDARKVIEALKDWMAREAGVDWSVHDVLWQKHDAAKIAVAQWNILQLDVTHSFDMMAFAEAVWIALGRPESLVGELLSVLSKSEWQTVNRVWGPAVRKARLS